MKRGLFVPRWARKISTHKENDLIIVEGEGHYPFGDDTLISAQSASGESRWMHIEFANAETDAELLNFVAKYGPVDGTVVKDVVHPRAISQPPFKVDVDGTFARVVHRHESKEVREVTVEQPIGKLREAQESVAAATRLVALRQLESFIPYETVNPLCARMARSVGGESAEQLFKDRLELVMSGVPSKRTINAFAQTEALAARDLLCQFLDKFPPKLGRVKDRIVELPGYDETGIVPILCYLVRQDFLSDLRTIGVCERCQRLFVVRRLGAQFCSPECSQLKRSLDYYHSQKSRAKKKSNKRARESAEG
jgi:hypothetical protein